jgi:hypothetical protein
VCVVVVGGGVMVCACVCVCVCGVIQLERSILKIRLPRL